MPTTNKVNQLVINKVESLEVYEALKAKGLSDEEIYLLTPEGIQKALDEKASEWKDIKNIPDSVPRIEVGEIIDLLPSTTFNVSEEDGGVFLTEPIGLVSGFTYTVNYNGTEYECVALDSAESLGQSGMIILGNIGAMTGGANTGEPFIIAEIIDEELIASMGGIYAQILLLDGSAEIVLSISGPEIIIHKVDERLLPDMSSYFVKGSNKGSMRHESSTIEDDTYVIGEYSFAEGFETKASGSYSHAEGYNTDASGYYGSHAEGYNTTASGQDSHAEGQNTTASGVDSHAEGGSTIASGSASHAEGQSTSAKAIGSHAEGYNTTANAIGSHAEGGNKTNASNDYATLSDLTLTTTEYPDLTKNVTIKGSLANGIQSHAEGTQTYAHGYSSHAEGYQTKAFGGQSHAEGYDTIASGVHSHAEGYETTAQRAYQHVQGKYNIPDTEGNNGAQGKYAHIVGNGSGSKHSNAHTLDWDGNAWFSGDVYTGSTSGTNKDTGSKKLATEEFVTQEVGKIEFPTLEKGTDPATTETTITPSTDKKITFTAMTDTSVNGHTITDTNTKFILDLSKFAELGDLSTAMVFKGTLGTGGTITALPTASNTLSSDTVGDTYKVITAGTYAGIAAKVGDVFICSDKPEWVLIPSGDEPSGTVTNIATGTDLTGGPITSTGTISHANITRTNPTVTTLTPGYAGSFNVVESVTTSNTGHVTAVQVRKVTMPSAQTIPILNKKTATVLTSATTISHSGGVATTNKIKATASGTAVGANGTASVVTGYPNVTNASFVNSVTPSTTTVVNGVSNTTAKALTDLGTASTVKAVTSYAAPTNASFVNSVTNTTTNVVSSVSNTTAAALTGLGTASTVKAVTGYTPTNASFVNGVTNTTTSVVSSVTSGSISVSNGILTIPKKTMLTGSSSATVINKVSSTTSKALTGLGTAATSNVVTGYASPTTANFVNSVSSGTTTVINKVSSTTSKALTGLGTASTTDVVTGYPNVTNASFVNGVGKTTTTVVNGISNTTAKALTGLGTPSTATALTGVKITAQPTIKLEFDNTNGQVSVVTGVSTPSVTLNQSTVNALTDATTLG